MAPGVPRLLGGLPPGTGARLRDQQHTAGGTLRSLQDEVMNMMVASRWSPLPSQPQVTHHSLQGRQRPLLWAARCNMRNQSLWPAAIEEPRPDNHVCEPGGVFFSSSQPGWQPGHSLAQNPGPGRPNSVNTEYLDPSLQRLRETT